MACPKLYRAYAISDCKKFRANGREYVQGKSRTATHEMVVAATSSKMAEEIARRAIGWRLKRDLSEVFVVDLPNEFHYLGEFWHDWKGMNVLRIRSKELPDIERVSTAKVTDYD